MAAANEIDLFNRLQEVGVELVQCASLVKKRGRLAGVGLFSAVKIRDLIQIFIHLDQMQGAGVPLLDALADIRDTTEQTRLRDVMAEIHRDVLEGSSLSEAMGRHPRIFNHLYTALISSGEETGNMTTAYRQLIKYLKWVDAMQAKVRKATRYPIILVVVIIGTIVIMMSYVVPQIIGFIRNLDQELPFYTTALMKTSDFFMVYWWAILGTPVLLFFLLRVLREMSDSVAYRLDVMMLGMPVMGPLIRKINIARFAQTFGALFASGIDILKCLESARSTVTNLAISEALESTQELVKAGTPLSEAFNASGEFPSLVVRMLRIGEESGNLTVVLDQVAEFYTNDVDEAVQGLITMIEPLLTGILGIMILWIAVAVFGPIYSSFEDMDF